MPRIPIVNENDEIISYKERDAVALEEVYRVSGLWITDSQGRILLAQRAFSKIKDPGKWGSAAAGTVEENETYDSNIRKEAQEELGLKDLDLVKAGKLREHTKYNYFSQWYLAVVDKPLEDFFIQKEEVERIRWFDPAELKKDLTENPDNYLKCISQCLDMFSK